MACLPHSLLLLAQQYFGAFHRLYGTVVQDCRGCSRPFLVTIVPSVTGTHSPFLKRRTIDNRTPTSCPVLADPRTSTACLWTSSRIAGRDVRDLHPVSFPIPFRSHGLRGPWSKVDSAHCSVALKKFILTSYNTEDEESGLKFIPLKRGGV